MLRNYKGEILLWREAEGLVFRVDPHADDAVFAALLRVGLIGHGRKRANAHFNDDAGARAVRRAGFQNLIALHRAVVAVGTKVSEKILHRVTRTRFPER